jgi:hypothetical protein
MAKTYTDGFSLQLKFGLAFIVVPISGEVQIRIEKLFLYVLRVVLEQNLAGSGVNMRNRLKTKMPVSRDKYKNNFSLLICTSPKIGTTMTASPNFN